MRLDTRLEEGEGTNYDGEINTSAYDVWQKWCRVMYSITRRVGKFFKCGTREKDSTLLLSCGVCFVLYFSSQSIQYSGVCVVDSAAHAVECHEYRAAKRCHRLIYSLCTAKQKLVKLDKSIDCLDRGVDLSYVCICIHTYAWIWRP